MDARLPSWIFALLVVGASASFGCASTPRAAQSVPAGTRLAVAFDRALEPSQLQPGDRVRARLETRLLDPEGHAIAEPGARIEATVVETDGARAIGLRFDRVETKRGWASLPARIAPPRGTGGGPSDPTASTTNRRRGPMAPVAAERPVDLVLIGDLVLPR
jgi:hypothetical protein